MERMPLAERGQCVTDGSDVSERITPRNGLFGGLLRHAYHRAYLVHIANRDSAPTRQFYWFIAERCLCLVTREILSRVKYAHHNISAISESWTERNNDWKGAEYLLLF